MKKFTKKRSLALALAMALVFSCTTPVLAAGNETAPVSEITESASYTDAMPADASETDALGTDAIGTETAGPLTVITDADPKADAKDSLLADMASMPEALNALPVETSDYTVKRYPNSVTVINNATQTGPEYDLYGVLIYSDPEKQSKDSWYATRIPAGGFATLNYVHGKNYETAVLDSTSDYTLLLGRSLEYTDEEGKTQYSEAAFIGYSPEYEQDAEGNYVEKKDENGNIIYVEENIKSTFNLPASSVITNEPTGYKDGFSTINMKAVLQKNMTVKISWAPKGNDPVIKSYKKYELYELTEDPSEPTGYKEKKIWPVKGAAQATGKSATVSVLNTSTHMADYSRLYMLKCFDKDGNAIEGAKYVAVTAPYMLSVQSGYTTGRFDFTFTQPADSDTMQYQLQIALKNKDADDKNIEGFKDDWSTYVSGGDIQYSSVGEYALNKKTSVKAVETEFDNDEPSVVLGSKYFTRVRAICTMRDMVVASAPSNVLNCKAGPDKCFVFDAAGVYYDADDAKKNNNVKNTARANDHYKSYLYGSAAERTDTYIHTTNTSVCAKSGLIYFSAPADESVVKSYELLKSDSEFGTYKKVKAYKVTDKAVLKISLPGEESENIRAIQYTSFTPDTTAYFKVRAVSKAGNAPGGLNYYGHAVEAEMDKVQTVTSDDTNASTISIAWAHDDCAKQYWIYRSKTSNPDRDQYNNAEYIGKVSGTSFKKIPWEDTEEDGTVNNKVYKFHIYKDTKVEADTYYYYYIRPVYDAKAATANAKSGAQYMSDEIRGKASAAYTQISNFKASNYAAGEIRHSFKRERNLTRYRIWRLEVPSSAKKLTESMKPDIWAAMGADESYEDFENRINGWSEEQWNTYFANYGFGSEHWEPVMTITSTGTSSASYTHNVSDKDIEIGSYYFYMIQGYTNKSAGLLLSYSGRAQSLPLAVTNVSSHVSGNTVSLSWAMNERDRGKGLTVKVSYDGGASWNVASSTGYTDTSLPKGAERTYTIAVFYGKFHGPTVDVKASRPIGLDIGKASGDGSFANSVLELNVGQTATLSIRPYLSDGRSSNVAVEESSISDGSIVDRSRNGNNYTITGKKKGTTNITFYSCGVSKTITVKVNDAPK